MRKFTSLLALPILVAIAFVSYSFSISSNDSESVTEEIAPKIEWMTWEEAIEKNDKNPKKIFIDVYTDWCGWCKRMDATTFKDKEVVNYMNEHFYSVKLDAEQKEDIVYKGHTFKYVANGRRGYHELAAALLENKMSYPSFVAMDEKVDRITIIPGYRQADDMLDVLGYIGDNNYKTKTYDQYIESKSK